MRKTHRSGPGAGVVTAARAGDPRALDQLVAECLPLVYNIVGRALNGHADVDDVVQETLLRMVRGLTELRDPGAFRSWLVAITIRQVRDHARLRATARDRSADLAAAEQIPDPGLDFAGLTILRLGLTEQRREVAEATRWLDEDDRELLSLWWLEESGELDRPELASALGLSDRHAAVRVQRMKKQMEAARVVVRALNAVPRCAELQAPADNWDGVPSPLWRKRFARHVRGCPVCGGMEEGLFPMDRLLSGLPLLAVPPALDPARVVAAVAREAGTPAAAPAGPGSSGGPGSPAGHRAAGRARHSHRAARPASRVFSTPVVSGAAVAAVVTVALVAAGLTANSSDTPQKAAAPARSAPVGTPTASPRPSAHSASPSPSVSASKSPAKKKATPKPTHKAPAAPPAVNVASTSKKGVGVWTFPGVSKALAASGASWFYTWSTQHSEVTSPPSAGFVPMIWGRDSVTPQNLSQAKSQGPYLLGFNEPDMAQQSNMTVEQALSLWPQLMDAGKVLGSPAVAYGGDTPGGWLDRFMSGAKAKGYRVDFITLHWYGGDFRTPEAVGQLTSYLNAVHQRYNKPIWLTEYALIDFSHGTRFPTPDQQAAFVTASTKALEGLPWLQRYAWFGLGADAAKPSSGLFTDGTTATAAGRAFQAAHS
ncbi:MULTISPECIES: sigma-70 family RNA polymerase sigma factor [unclassified Streptomyces]|uniref:sigma-70 family RNA polymerase sigma factor n=1 Tax=unclassified Streptomyces TaxID=2593676 RepID=UPI0038045728